MSSTPSRRRSPWWVAAAAGTSGVLTYCLLIVVARAVGPASYAQFNGFWAAVVVTSVGAFLPLEQVLARREASGAGRGVGAAAVVTRAALLLATASVVVIGVLELVKGRGVGEAAEVAGVFAVACLGFAAQFPARGLLAGSGDLRSYAAVLVTDNVLRTAGAALQMLAGVADWRAYAAVVAVSALGAGVLARVLARGLRGTPIAVGEEAGLRGEVASLVVALTAMQAVLNSGNIVVSLPMAAGDAVVAGALAASLALVRVPVFVQQFAQAAYLARVASVAARRDTARLRRLLGGLAGAALGLAGATVVGALLLGPWAVELAFGEDYAVDRGTVTLLAAALGTFLVAAVANDVTVATRGHRRAAAAWVVGVVTSVVAVVVVQDVVLRTAAPLLVGSGVALAVLVPPLVTLVRQGELR